MCIAMEAVIAVKLGTWLDTARELAVDEPSVAAHDRSQYYIQTHKSCVALATGPNLLGFFAELITGTCSHSYCMVDIGSPCFSYSEPSVLISDLPVSRCGKTDAGHSSKASKSWGSWSLILLSLPWCGKLFLVGEFSLGTERCWPGGRGAQRIWSCSSFFHAIILNCSVPLCCWVS